MPIAEWFPLSTRQIEIGARPCFGQHMTLTLWATIEVPKAHAQCLEIFHEYLLDLDL
jgi:hypothetical protein